MKFIRLPLLIFMTLFLTMTLGGVFATWYYSTEYANSSENDSPVSINKFIYSDEVVILKITPVSSTVTEEKTTYTHPTKVFSSIKGNAGQKIVYKVEARNFSKTKTYIYTGASYNTLTGLDI